MTQFDNFLFSQMTLEEIAGRETVLLNTFLEMNPEQIYFDLVVGWHHTEGWKKIFQPFGTVDYADDMIYIRRKVKLAKYNDRGVDFKFYRMNTDENREHTLKYPFGWMGLTKLEIPTPILEIRDKEGCQLALQILQELQRIRENIVGAVWQDIQHQVGAKTYARSDSLYAWSCNDQNLRGTLKMEESELTRRQRSSARAFMETLENFSK